MQKSAVRLINSSKNKLSSKIIFIFHPNPNAHLIYLYFIRSVVVVSQQPCPNWAETPN